MTFTADEHKAQREAQTSAQAHYHPRGRLRARLISWANRHLSLYKFYPRNRKEES